MNIISLQNQNRNRIIDGIIMYPLKVNKDESGILVETLRKDWKEIYGPGREFSMQYFSVTAPGIARDEDVWHCHPTQEDRFLVASGEIITVVADNRKNSRTNGLLNLFYMRSDKSPYVLLIPYKTLHGFLVVSKSPAVLLNFPTGLYNPDEEKRISHKLENFELDGEKFRWNMVRKHFNLPLLDEK